MKKIKAVGKIIALIVFTLSSYAVYLVGYFFIRIAGKPTKSWRNLYTKNWARGSAFIMSVKIKTEGTPPEPPFFLVANHLSYLDILPLFVNLKCTFVAKKRGGIVAGFGLSGQVGRRDFYRSVQKTRCSPC